MSLPEPVKKRQAPVIKYDLKMKILREFDEWNLSKSELARSHGISVTSVTRILNNREELEALQGTGVDPDRRVYTKSKGNNSKGVKPKGKKSQNLPISVSSGEEEDEEEEEETVVFPHSRNSAPEYDDPEASFEKALKQLEEYTVQLMACDVLIYDNQNHPAAALAAPSDDLYELYEELMETEFRMRNVIC